MGSMDLFLQLEDDRDLNGLGVATHVSTNKKDWEVARNVPAGTPIYGNLVLSETVTSGGGATIRFAFVVADDAALTVNVVHVAETDVLALASLVEGAHWSLPLGDVPGGDKQFAGLLIIVAGAALTGGELTAWISHNPIPNQTQYPSGFTVS